MKCVLTAVVLAAAVLTSAALVRRSGHDATVAQAQNVKPEATPAKPSKPGQPSQPAQPSHPAPEAPQTPPLDWKTLEAPLLTNHVQLTSRDRFVKAGEAYFSPDSRWIIFQAVAVPQKDVEPAPFYSMYVAKVKHDALGKIVGLEEPFMISPPGSANSCGWFHPTEKARVLYGSTLGPPADNQPAGFKVGTRDYRWQFPIEMEVVTQTVLQISKDYGLKPGVGGGGGGGADSAATTVFSREGYDAECSYSADGRYILYTHAEEKPTPDGQAKLTDADIWVYDTKTGKHTALVVADGYDGGPFFSPDGKRLCYRSDRKHDNLLQIYVATIAFDETGVPTGTRDEIALTDNAEVNWAPFWHPSGKFLIYGNSGSDHSNYEVFAVEVPPVGDIAPGGALLRRHRVTVATGADILPVFSPDGKYMMWTSQRGPKAEGEQRPSSQLWAAEWTGAADLFK